MLNGWQRVNLKPYHPRLLGVPSLQQQSFESAKSSLWEEEHRLFCVAGVGSKEREEVAMGDKANCRATLKERLHHNVRGVVCGEGGRGAT